MRKFSILAIAILASVAQSCSKIPNETGFTRGQAESLLSVNSESVSIDLGQRNALAQVVNYVNNDNASRAILTCSNGLLCNRVESVLNQYGVPYEVKSGAGNSVAVIFDNIIARDCDNKYYSNHNNPYNLSHTTFGCSMAMNQAMMVRDKRQYTDPVVLGPYDGFKAAQNYDSYLARELDDRVIRSGRDSITGTSESNSGGR